MKKLPRHCAPLRWWVILCLIMAWGFVLLDIRSRYRSDSVYFNYATHGHLITTHRGRLLAVRYTAQVVAPTDSTFPLHFEFDKTLARDAEFAQFTGSALTWRFGGFQRFSVHIPYVASDIYTVPLWPVYLILGIPVIRWWMRVSQRQRRLHRGFCPQCGYDLRATPHRCPECGLVFNHASDNMPSISNDVRG